MNKFILGMITHWGVIHMCVFISIIPPLLYYQLAHLLHKWFHSLYLPFFSLHWVIQPMFVIFLFCSKGLFTFFTYVRPFGIKTTIDVPSCENEGQILWKTFHRFHTHEVYFQCVYTNGPSHHLESWRFVHIHCIYKGAHHYESVYAPSIWNYWWMVCHTEYICIALRTCEYITNDLSSWLNGGRTYHTGCICVYSPQCACGACDALNLGLSCYTFGHCSDLLLVCCAIICLFKCLIFWNDLKHFSQVGSIMCLCICLCLIMSLSNLNDYS